MLLKDQLPEKLVARGQNCTVKCNPFYISPGLWSYTPLHEKYNELFCSDCPDNLVSEDSVRNSMPNDKCFIFLSFSVQKVHGRGRQVFM